MFRLLGLHCCIGFSLVVANGATLKVTLAQKVTAVGDYTLVIPEGLITRASDGKVFSGELAVTVVAPEAIVVKSVSPSEDIYSLTTIEITFSKELVAAEDKRNPLTDEELMEQWRLQGFSLARRTVAKYREHLHIPVARLRRE